MSDASRTFDESSALAHWSRMQAVALGEMLPALSVHVVIDDRAWNWTLFEVRSADGDRVLARVSIDDELRIGDNETVRSDWTDFLPALVVLTIPRPSTWRRSKVRWRWIASTVIATEEQAFMSGYGKFTEASAPVFVAELAELARSSNP